MTHRPKHASLRCGLLNRHTAPQSKHFYMKIIPAGNDTHAAVQKESRANSAAFCEQTIGGRCRC
jgi:hypothetical protein